MKVDGLRQDGAMAECPAELQALEREAAEAPRELAALHGAGRLSLAAALTE